MQFSERYGSLVLILLTCNNLLHSTFAIVSRSPSSSVDSGNPSFSIQQRQGQNQPQPQQNAPAVFELPILELRPPLPFQNQPINNNVPFSSSPTAQSFIISIPTSPLPPPNADNNFVNEPPELKERPLISINGEKVELLPPVEIPPDRPIDVEFDPLFATVQQQQSRGNTQSQSRPQGQPQSQGAQPQGQSSSLIPTTGTGTGFEASGGGDNSNPSSPFLQQFNPSPSQSQFVPINPPPTRSGSNPPRSNNDPGLDCLGSCDCPGDFNFVCGSNRFLYQNDCALECDKRCHPDVVKVGMDHCSR